jgi:ABC-type molybdate transport system substrate-binding protein
MKRVSFLLLVSTLRSFAPTTARADEIILSAAASLTDALRGIGKAYQTKSA